MRVYQLTFPMRGGRSRRGIFSARQLNAFFKAWEGLVTDGELPGGLRVEVKTVEADGPVDDADLLAYLDDRRSPRE